jgi:hypothetical protein
MTHDYQRHGTTMLFAALNEIEGTVIGRNMQRHRHQDFIRFLNAIEEVPAGKAMHVILDTYAAHKYSNVRRRLDRHRRFIQLHANIVFVAQRHRSFFAKQTAMEARGLRLGCRPVNCYQSLRRRTQY